MVEFTKESKSSENLGSGKKTNLRKQHSQAPRTSENLFLSHIQAAGWLEIDVAIGIILVTPGDYRSICSYCSKGIFCSMDGFDVS